MPPASRVATPFAAPREVEGTPPRVAKVGLLVRLVKSPEVATACSPLTSLADSTTAPVRPDTDCTGAAAAALAGVALESSAAWSPLTSDTAWLWMALAKGVPPAVEPSCTWIVLVSELMVISLALPTRAWLIALVPYGGMKGVRVAIRLLHQKVVLEN